MNTPSQTGLGGAEELDGAGPASGVDPVTPLRHRRMRAGFRSAGQDFPPVIPAPLPAAAAAAPGPGGAPGCLLRAPLLLSAS